MTEQLENIRREVIEEIETEQMNIKLSLVRDCINTERFLFAHYPDTHSAVINDWLSVFNYYYDMDIEQLQVELASLCAKGSAAARMFVDRMNAKEKGGYNG